MSDMQAQRFERKFLLTVEQASKVREFLKSYLELDEFSADKPTHDYPVHSLYLDSDCLATYWATIQCEKTRFKLRVRYYDDKPGSPVFFEIKRRVNECILKQRGAVRRDAAAELLAGHLPTMEYLLKPNPAHLAALQRFCQLMHQLHARPKMHIAYEREAWETPGSNAVRITFDKSVRGACCREGRFGVNLKNPVYPFPERWVLEVKYTNRFPNWLTEMVRHLNLVQTGAAKYCGSIIGIEDFKIATERSPILHSFERADFAGQQVVW